MTALRVAVVGLGYFSQFHLTSWAAMEDADLIGVTDLDVDLTSATADRLGVTAYPTLQAVLDDDPDIIDLVVPPTAHASLIRACLKPGRTLICQKPFCRSLAEAEQITAEAETAQTTLIIHENFRFQPWYREVKTVLASGLMGQIYCARFALRPGDGRGAEAYLARQPSFQQMPRFLVQETAVHFIDTFRWLFGPISSVYADLRQLNPVIQGEDIGTLLLTHKSGTQSVFDGNRLSDHAADNPRLTMGEMRIEGEGGALSLDGFGNLTFRAFGSHSSDPVPMTAPVDATQFGGGCVDALNRHVVAALSQGQTPENTARDYLEVIRVCDAAYLSHTEGRRITL